MNNAQFRQLADLERKVKQLNRALSTIASLADDALAATQTNHHNVTRERLSMMLIAVRTADPTLLPRRMQSR